MPKIIIDNFSRGENWRDSPKEMEPGELYGAEVTGTSGASNMQSSTKGRMERRYGVAQAESGFSGPLGTADAITGAAMYRPSNSGGSKMLLFACKKRVHSATYSAGVLTYDADISASDVNLGNNYVSMAQFGDWMYMAVPHHTGTSGYSYRFDGVKSDGSFGGVSGFNPKYLAVPSIAGITATSANPGGRMTFNGSGGAGEYRYRFTYVHGALGESNMSAPVSASALAATATGKVTLAAMPWTAAAYRNATDRRTITAVKVYRTLITPNLSDDSLNTYYLVATLTTFTAGYTFDDVKDDIELVRAYEGDEPYYDGAQFDFELVPRYFCAHKNRLFAGNFQNRNSGKLYTNVISWSFLDRPCKTQGATAIKDLDGYGINGLWSFKGELIVFKGNEVYAVSGSNPSDFSTGGRPVIGDFGCIAPRSIAEGDGYLWWLSARGVVRWDGYGAPEIVSSKIRPFFELASAAGKESACGGFHRGRYYISLNRYESSVWVFDSSYASPGAWYRWANAQLSSDLNPYMFLKLDEVQENGEFYMLADSVGSSGGCQIRRFHDARSVSGAPRFSDRVTGTDTMPTCYYDTGWINAGSPDTIKNFKSLTIDHEELGAGVRIAIITDTWSNYVQSTLANSLNRTGAGTEASPYSGASLTGSVTLQLPQEISGRRIRLQVNQSNLTSTVVQKPLWINRMVIDFEESGQQRPYGDY